MSKKISENVKTVLGILKDEIRGDMKSALQKMAKNYSMTWVYAKKDGALFPRTKKDVTAEMKEVYPIKGRKYDIKHVAEGKNVVMVEMVESYPDPETGKVYRTPLVIVLELQNGKIKKGRHYCDPALSYMDLTEKQVKAVFA